MDKRYQVFISSTYSDLIDERAKIFQILMELDCIPAGMELFPAIDDEQFNFIKRIIDDSDYYLLIIGGRYGSLSADGISFTEKEYDYAIEKGIKVMAFIHSKPDTIPLGKSEKDEELRNKLEAFKKKVSTGRLVKFWENSEQLAGQVSLSLSKTIKTYPAIGWIRSNELPSSMLSEELATLSKENRSLKNELENLKSSTKDYKPNIEVSVNDLTSMALLISERIVREWEIFTPFNKSDFGNAAKSISDEYIDAYNTSIRNNLAKAEKYNTELVLYKRATQEALPVNIIITNSGSAMATELHIDIKFPNEILVFEKNNMPSEPAHPSAILTHPLNKMMEAQNEKLKAMSRMFKTAQGIEYSKMISVESIINPNRIFVIENNTIKIYLKSLLHTRSHKIFDKLVFVALKPGEYVIEISGICKELPQPIEFQLPISINNKN